MMLYYVLIANQSQSITLAIVLLTVFIIIDFDFPATINCVPRQESNRYQNGEDARIVRCSQA